MKLKKVRKLRRVEKIVQDCGAELHINGVTVTRNEETARSRKDVSEYIERAPKYNIARVTMRQFVEAIGDDEEMLKFAAEHLDADEEAIVEIRIAGNSVNYELVEN